jgi:hypothetical protein
MIDISPVVIVCATLVVIVCLCICGILAVITQTSVARPSKPPRRNPPPPVPQEESQWRE